MSNPQETLKCCATCFFYDIVVNKNNVIRTRKSHCNWKPPEFDFPVPDSVKKTGRTIFYSYMQQRVSPTEGEQCEAWQTNSAS